MNQTKLKLKWFNKKIVQVYYTDFKHDWPNNLGVISRQTHRCNELGVISKQMNRHNETNRWFFKVIQKNLLWF